ncbi:glycerophosphoryl diester phosphodiesterase membrane domain-containing protein [Glutamicibacter arilaitensis]|uniref:glycerophosphoryl diester phosphodiesterase membrane domain-containing protein n=1 Tax=Glutamicibacter arilaitensis TaxID=256701 RepID=UPI003FD20217
MGFGSVDNGMKTGGQRQKNSPALPPILRQGWPKFLEAVPFLARIMKLSHARIFRYLGIIVLMQSINGFVVLPVIKYLFGKALEASSLSNITDRTYPAILAHPVSVALLIAIAMIALIAVSLQFTTIVVMVNRQQSGQPPSVRAMCQDVAKCLGRLLSYPSPVMLVYFFLALPMGGLGLSSVLIQGVGIPPFITREYLKAPLSTGIYAVMIAAIIYANLRLILTLPLLVVGRKCPLAAVGESLRATHKNFFRHLLLLGIPLGAAVLGASVMIELLVWGTDLADSLVTAQTSAMLASISIGLGHSLGFLIIGAATVVMIQVLVALCRERLGLPVILEERSLAHRTAQQRGTRASLASVAFGLVISVSFSAMPAMGDTTEGAENTLVIGHRGYSGGGVENTLGGLEAAAANQADVVEADFQETKDGHFVASHDTNLLMVAGRNQNIYEMTLVEVQEVTVREGGFTDKIPTMGQYLKRADELGIQVLVELKVTGHEKAGYLKRFLAEVDATGTTEKNIYHSLNGHAVQEIKKQRPKLRVGLTVAMSFGGLPKTNGDFYTVEQASFSEELLAEAHARDKEVYVWTVNDQATIRQLLSIPVDGIVTDNVKLAVDNRAMVATNPASEYQVGYSLAYLDIFR